jgi:hypothetical protein
VNISPDLPASPAVFAVARSIERSRSTILALDLGTITGFAIAGVDGGITGGTAEFRLDRWQSGGMRFLRFKRWLMVEAADVMRRLPLVRVPGYFNTWPPVVVEFADRVGQEPEPMRLPPPSPAAISRMEETLGWLRGLNAEHAKLVWARAEGTPWKQVCWRFGISRATAHRRWRYALSLIAFRLNGRGLMPKRPRRLTSVMADGL